MERRTQSMKIPSNRQSDPEGILRKDRLSPDIPLSPTSPEPQLDGGPLYQEYHRNAVTRDIVQQTVAENDSGSSDGDLRMMDEETVKRRVTKILRESKIQRDGSRQSCLFDVLTHGIGQLNLWRDMPEVKTSGLLANMDSKERGLQEALFEIISSEASYLRSLNVLVDHFYNGPVFQGRASPAAANKHNQHYLFSNIKKVQEVSRGFLQKLRALKKKNVVLDPIEVSDIITDYAEKHFDVYVIYTKNQAYQDRALKQLRDRDSNFHQGLLVLEKDRKAQGLPFHSFLLLPVQRITRLPLLIDNALGCLAETAPGFDKLKSCLHVLQKIVKHCNDEAKKMADIEHVAKIAEMLDFKKTKNIPIVSGTRHLVKEGNVINLGPYTFGPGTLRKAVPLYMFLFNDLLLVTKKKSATSYEVLEYLSKEDLEADLLEESSVSEYLPQGVPSGCKNLFTISIKDRGFKAVISCESTSDRMRWKQALTPPPEAKEPTTMQLYRENDCPQVQAIQKYTAREPDELSLEESDIVNLHTKLTDGWCLGQCLHDNQKGWFPATVTVEIQSAHMRARNLRQHYRMLFGHYRQSQEFLC